MRALRFPLVALTLVVGCGSSSSPMDAMSRDDAAADVSRPESDGPVPTDALAMDGAPLIDATWDGSIASDGPAPNDAPFTASVRDIDLLFMIDNSPSMAEEQANLRKNFPVLIDELKKLPGGLPNLHIGIVSSDLGAGPTGLQGGCMRPRGDRGILLTKAGCNLDPGARFIDSAQNGTQNNFTGDISTVFQCLASIGTSGCGYEHQLAATRVALREDLTPDNAGFLREGAALAIVLISDEDDCSAPPDSDLFTDASGVFTGTDSSFRCAFTGHLCGGQTTPLSEFTSPLEDCQASGFGRLIKIPELVASIRELKRDPARQILVSGIFGWPTNTLGAQYRYVKTQDGLNYAPICQSANGDATAGLRLKAFVDAFGTNGHTYGICDGDFTPAMRHIGQRLTALGGP